MCMWEYEMQTDIMRDETDWMIPCIIKPAIELKAVMILPL